MSELCKVTVATCLLLASASSAAAQNSSLMRPPASMQGYQPPTNAPLPPFPPEASAPVATVAQRFDPWAQGVPSSDFDPYQRVPRPVVSLNEASWTYQPAPPVRTYQRNDVITIRVDEITRMQAEGNSFNRKRTLAELILTDWIRLKDFRLRPDPQRNGDPAVAAESNNNFRAQALLESRESLTFNIAATVVDIRPNGNLVLEARKAIRVNDNLWETSLSGMCRAEDIAPDNVVLSKDLIDLEIRKEDRGHLRDAYSRG